MALPATYGLQETPEEEDEARVNFKGPQTGVSVLTRGQEQCRAKTITCAES